MKKTKWLICALVICSMHFFASAFTGRKEEGPSGFFLTGNRKQDRIPFKFRSNLIIVPVQINGSDTLNFILDTGVASTIITDPSVLDKGRLDLKRKLMIEGLGDGEMISGHTAIGNSLSMWHMQVNQHNMLVLDEPVSSLSGLAGMPIHGIIGYEIFNSFVVTLDFARKELLLTYPGKYRYSPKKGDKLPISVTNTKPYLTADTKISGKEHKDLRYMIDTGAGHALLIDHSANTGIRLPALRVELQEAVGLNGMVKGSLGRTDELTLGAVKLTRILTSFPDSIAFGSKIVDREGRQGSIGCELLRRFKVTFHYPQNYIVLKPVHKKIRESYEYNMSGLQVLAAGEKLEAYFIHHVDENSPGSEAGLKKGDRILYIDGMPVKEMNLSEVYQLLKKGDGKDLDVMVLRDKKSFFALVKLRRII